MPRSPTTSKLIHAQQAFVDDIEGAKWTMMRISQIQAAMSHAMDEALGEFKDLFDGPGTGQGEANDLSAYSKPMPKVVADMAQPRAPEYHQEGHYEDPVDPVAELTNMTHPWQYPQGGNR